MHKSQHVRKTHKFKSKVPEVKRIIKLYNLDMIISVGYRVKSKRGVAFRQKDMAMLLDVSTDNIGLHIANILDEGELDNSTTEKSSVVQTEGKRQVKLITNLLQ